MPEGTKAEPPAGSLSKLSPCSLSLSLGLSTFTCEMGCLAQYQLHIQETPHLAATTIMLLLLEVGSDLGLLITKCCHASSSTP